MTNELKEKYADHEETSLIYETLELKHPNFPTAYIIKSSENKTLKLEDGSSVEFEAYPFAIQLPEVGNNNQDLNIMFDNVSLRLVKSLEDAIKNPDKPIECIYRVYISAIDIPQTLPLRLWLTNISLNSKTISATATRADLYARKFPFGGTTLYDRRFAGLFL